MFATDDTIVAVATPPGRGGLGVVRISGTDSLRIAGRILDTHAPLVPRRATFTRVAGLDQAVSTYFQAPRSYTGEDVVEISTHGSPVVLQAIVRAAIDAGARLAEPGEFTLRAYLHERIDLIQAEAVADLIDAVTPLQARAAFDQLEGTLTTRIATIDDALFDLCARLEASLDFPDEGYHFIGPGDVAREIGGVRRDLEALCAEAGRGRLLREGAQVVIVGRANAGKSSVFNRLAGHDRAIVADLPGTTRDLVTERVDIGGVPMTLVDTAGLRDPQDVVEREGIVRAQGAMAVGALLVVVVDRSAPLDGHDRAILAETASRPRVIVANKIDRPAAWIDGDDEGVGGAVDVSARTGDGVDELRRAMVERLAGGEALRDTPAISNVRHITLLESAAAHVAAAERAAEEAMPEEFLLADLQQARAALEEVTGRRTSEDTLRHIFERFCVGK